MKLCSVICISVSFTVLWVNETPFCLSSPWNVHSLSLSFTAYDGKAPGRPSVPQENSSPSHYSLKLQSEQPVITRVSISSHLLVFASDWTIKYKSGCLGEETHQGSKSGFRSWHCFLKVYFFILYLVTFVKHFLIAQCLVKITWLTH